MSDLTLVFATTCPDPRWSWRLVADLIDVLERHGFTGTELRDPEWAWFEMAFHDLIFDGPCHKGHR